MSNLNQTYVCMYKVGGRNLPPTMDRNISGLEVSVEDEVSGLRVRAFLLPLCMILDFGMIL